MPKIAFIPLVCLVMCSSVMAQELPLYNGPEYTGYYHGVNGHPFFQSDSLLPADVFYDGILYRNLKIGFNLADNEVYIKEPRQGYAIRLVNDKLGYFTIDNHHFVRIPEGSSYRFYEVIYKNDVKVYVQRVKLLKQAFRPEDPMKFVEYLNYYVAKKGRLQRIPGLNAVKPGMKNDSVLNYSISNATTSVAAAPLIKKSFEENRLYELGSSNNANKKTQLSLAGYIRDAKTGESVIGVTVQVDSSSLYTMTDQFGYYSIDLSPGKHEISFSGAGIVNTRRQIILNENGKLDVIVNAQTNSLKTVVVTAERNSTVKNPQMGIERLAIKTIKQVPVVFGEADVLRVVTTLPGVSTAGEAGAGFNVRGGSTDQNLILFNDATIYNPSHLFGFFSAFNPDIVKAVELYKSSVPEKYGGRLSSVLDITSREGNNKKIAGMGGVGALTSKLTLEGPLTFTRRSDSRNPATSFIISGRTTYSDWLLKSLPDERYRNSRASFNDLSLNITHNANKNNSIYFSGYLSTDKFRLNNDTSYSYGNKNINLKWKHIFHNKLYSVVAGGYDHYGYAIENDKNPVNAFKLNFNINQAHFRTNFTYSPSNAHAIDFGIHSVYYKLYPGSYLPGAKESIVVPDELRPEKALETAVYLGDRYNVNSDLAIRAGIRYSFFNFLDSGRIIKTWHAPEIRLSARYTVSDNSSVKLAFNTTRQYIHMLSNTIIVSPADTWKLSDDSIKPQQAYQLSAGYYRNFASNTIEFSVETYYKRMKKVLDYRSGARLIMNHHIAADVISAKGKSYGVEFMVKKLSGKLNGWISYTWSRTFLQQNDSLAGEIINHGKYYAANFDKPHNLNVISNYRFTHRFSLSLNLVYTTGRPVTVPVAIFDLGGAERVYYSERNQYRVPDYFRTDVSFIIEGNHKLKQRAHNSWSFGVYNLFARKNPYSVYFKQEEGIIKGYQLSIFGTIIPFVTYNFRF